VLVALVAVSGVGGASAQQSPKRGGTLVIGTLMAGEPPCLNAYVDACGVPGVLDRGLTEVLAGAFEGKPDGTYRPTLISRASIVSRLPFTLVYHIRPEARWSDGVPVTASDFVFTHRAIAAHRPAFEYDPTFVRAIRALDQKTFKLVLREPFPDWRYLFRMVLPRHVLAGQKLESVWKDAIDNPRTGQLIGSGPFLVGSWARGKQLVLVRNPHYWGGHAAFLDRVVFRFLPVADIGEALRRGDVDMINPGSRILEEEAIELRHQPAPGIRVSTVPGGSIEHFDIRIGDGGHPALKSRLVRQALAYGIDRVEIARRIGELSYEDEAALQPLDSVVFPKSSPYYRPNWKDYRYRPARARQLIEQAGCRRGSDGIYSCGGQRLSLRLATVTGIEARARTLELAQAELRQIGVEVVPRYVLFDPFFDQVYGGDFDLALYSWGAGGSATWPGTTFECQQPDNPTGYCDRLVTRDLDQATRTIDDRRRTGLLNSIDVRLARAAPVIPLYQGVGLFARKATVRGVVPSGAGSNFTWNAENWWIER